jgi:hypothetical protein
MTDQSPNSNNQSAGYINQYQPPQQENASVQATSGSQPAAQVDGKEKLEDQNIFDLLGVASGSEAEKSQFLDELQQVIWEDFLENDVNLLILDSEHQKLKEILGSSTANLSVETQEKVISYLEEIVPDLEEIMIDKAIRLKGDLVRERITGLKQVHAGNAQAETKIQMAEEAVAAEKWKTAATILNSI